MGRCVCAGGYIEGDIKVAGSDKEQQTFARISGYVEQTDVHSPQVRACPPRLKGCLPASCTLLPVQTLGCELCSHAKDAQTERAGAARSCHMQQSACPLVHKTPGAESCRVTFSRHCRRPCARRCCSPRGCAWRPTLTASACRCGAIPPYGMHSRLHQRRQYVLRAPALRAFPQAFVEEVMALVELTPLRSVLVGIPGVSGLSVEQRKRLTIAVELVANPAVVFMVRAAPLTGSLSVPHASFCHALRTAWHACPRMSLNRPLHVLPVHGCIICCLFFAVKLRQLTRRCSPRPCAWCGQAACHQPTGLWWPLLRPGTSWSCSGCWCAAPPIPAELPGLARRTSRPAGWTRARQPL